MLRTMICGRMHIRMCKEHRSHTNTFVSELFLLVKDGITSGTQESTASEAVHISRTFRTIGADVSIPFVRIHLTSLARSKSTHTRTSLQSLYLISIKKKLSLSSQKYWMVVSLLHPRLFWNAKRPVHQFFRCVPTSQSNCKCFFVCSSASRIRMYPVITSVNH